MFRLVSLLMIFMTLSVSECTVTIFAVPETIEVGLTTEFNITCSVPHDTTGAVTALRIFHRTSDDQHFTELANIDRFNHTVSHDPYVANITGHVDEHGSTYLTLLWVYPTSLKSGLYVCNVSKLVSSPHIHTLHETTNITVNYKKPDFGQVIQELRKIREYLDRQLKIEADSRKNSLESFINLHFEQFSQIGKKSYLLSKQINMTAMQAEIMCHLVGGYLAELNQTDLVQIQTQLNATNSLEDEVVLIGGNNPELTGRWVYLRNRQPMSLPTPFILGQDGECLALDATQNYECVTIPCSNPNIRVPSKFLCEIQS